MESTLIRLGKNISRFITAEVNMVAALIDAVTAVAIPIAKGWNSQEAFRREAFESLRDASKLAEGTPIFSPLEGETWLREEEELEEKVA